MADTVSSRPRLGFIGVGELGELMALRLLNAKYFLSIYDANYSRTDKLRQAGARVAASPQDLASGSTVILVALPSSRSDEVIEKQLLPNIGTGKTLIDFGTMSVEKTHALARRLDSAGVQFLDAPISGGPGAAQKGTLAIFAGGNKKTFDACMPIFSALCGPGSINYCGPAGSGQVVSSVDRLASGLATAAFLEALAFGVRSGISLDLLKTVLGENTSAAKVTVGNVMTKITHAGPEAASVRYEELRHLQDGLPATALPLTSALLGFLKNAPSAIIEKGHHVPSFWDELQRNRNV